MHPKIAELLARPRILQHTEDWFKARKIRLTASDIGSVLGHNKYCKADEVFLRKTFQSKPFNSNNIACNHGHKYEALAAKAYEQITGIKLIEEDIGLVTHQLFPEFGASPDRVTLESPILIEIKCPYRRKIIPGEIPQMYIDQIEFQMAVCDLDICHFVQFKPGQLTQRGQVDITEYHRDPEWWNDNYLELHTFWKSVIEYWAHPSPYTAAAAQKRGREITIDSTGDIVPPPKEFDSPVAKPQESKQIFEFTTDLEYLPNLYDVTIQKHKSIKNNIV